MGMTNTGISSADMQPVDEQGIREKKLQEPRSKLMRSATITTAEGFRRLPKSALPVKVGLVPVPPSRRAVAFLV